MQDVQGASEAFTVVLELSGASEGDRLAAASNRAACHLAQAQYSSTVADCNLALDLLLGIRGSASQAHSWSPREGMHQNTVDNWHVRSGLQNVTVEPLLVSTVMWT